MARGNTSSSKLKLEKTKQAKPPDPRTHHTSDMYGIFRKAQDAKTGQQAWVVRLSRGGRNIQTTFSDSTYGSREASLYVARAFRDAVLEIVPPLTRAEMRQVSRRKKKTEYSSDMTGVHYIKANKTHSAAWVARIDLPDHKASLNPQTRRPRKSRTKRFSVSVYGLEGAKAAAEEARQNMLAQLQDRDEPALRSKAAERLHRRLGEKGTEKPDQSDNKQE